MASTSTSTSPTSSATSSARPIIGEPASGQTLLDYPAGLLAAAYPRMAAAGLTGAEASVYGSASAASAYAAAAAAQSYLPTLSTDPSVLYGSLAVSSQNTNLYPKFSTQNPAVFFSFLGNIKILTGYHVLRKNKTKRIILHYGKQYRNILHDRNNFVKPLNRGFYEHVD